MSHKPRRVSIVVLGDIGRSPRMQHHAFSLALAGAEVDVVAYRENAVTPAVAAQNRIRWHALPCPWRVRANAPRWIFLFAGLVRVAWDAGHILWRLLATVRRPDVILVQNPPSIPALVVAWFASRLVGAEFVIDWHNFGHAILALRLGTHHPAVALGRWFERVVGQRADVHLCVSQAMQRLLELNWGISATLLYDCPPEWFRPSDAENREKTIRELLALVPNTSSQELSLPGLIVAPSSWTAEDDFSLLLEGLRRWDELLRTSATLTPLRAGTSLLVLLTGKGPFRPRFEANIGSLELHHIAVRTLWVEPADYSTLLGVADVGICMHNSASGVDIPIKIADMFGSGLPVVAFDYGAALRERLQHGVNGLCFRNAEELAHHLHVLFASYPKESGLMRSLKTNALASAEPRWQDEWATVARPLFFPE